MKPNPFFITPRRKNPEILENLDFQPTRVYRVESEPSLPRGSWLDFDSTRTFESQKSGARLVRVLDQQRMAATFLRKAVPDISISICDPFRPRVSIWNFASIFIKTKHCGQAWAANTKGISNKGENSTKLASTRVGLKTCAVPLKKVFQLSGHGIWYGMRKHFNCYKRFKSLCDAEFALNMKPCYCEAQRSIALENRTRINSE